MVEAYIADAGTQVVGPPYGTYISVKGDIPEPDAGSYFEVSGLIAYDVSSVSVTGSAGAANQYTTITLSDAFGGFMNTAPKLDDQSTLAEDDDLIGQYLQLSLGALNQAMIVDNDKSSSTVTLRGDWSNLITTSDYVKIYCRESRVGNKALYAGQHGYRWDGGFVTVSSTRYRLPNLYWVHHRAYNTDWGRWNQRDPIGIFTDAPNIGNGYGYVGNSPVNALDPTGLDGIDVQELVEDVIDASPLGPYKALLDWLLGREKRVLEKERVTWGHAHYDRKTGKWVHKKLALEPEIDSIEFSTDGIGESGNWLDTGSGALPNGGSDSIRDQFDCDDSGFADNMVEPSDAIAIGGTAYDRVIDAAVAGRSVQSKVDDAIRRWGSWSGTSPSQLSSAANRLAGRLQDSIERHPVEWAMGAAAAGMAAGEAEAARQAFERDRLDDEDLDLPGNREFYLGETPTGAGMERTYRRKWVEAQVLADTEFTEIDGNRYFVDPTSDRLVNFEERSEWHWGHAPGHEWWRIRDKAVQEGWTREQLADYYNDPAKWRLEGGPENMSHKGEMK